MSSEQPYCIVRSQHKAGEEPGRGPPDAAKSTLMGFGVARGHLAGYYYRSYNTVTLSPQSTIQTYRHLVANLRARVADWSAANLSKTENCLCC